MSFPGNVIAGLKRDDLYRELPVHNRNTICFSSNDYLNLSTHPDVIRAASESLNRWGAGAGGSRLMSGNLEIHQTLEESIAELTGTESSLVYGSGYLANYGVLTALAGRGDTIFIDRLVHSSLISGALASGAAVKRYSHCDTGHLRKLISGCGEGKRLIVTDSVFSMDGDTAPLEELSETARENRCMLMVDEAHAMGIAGGGGGVCRSLGLTPHITTGTLSKALGSYGGFAACSRELRELLVNRSRSFIYSTGLPPSCAAAALESIRIIRRNPELGETLLKRAACFRSSLSNLGGEVMNSTTQVVPLLTGTPARALGISSELLGNNIDARAIRPPTVPTGTSRLRFSITLAHTPEDLNKTLAILEELL